MNGRLPPPTPGQVLRFKTVKNYLFELGVARSRGASHFLFGGGGVGGILVDFCVFGGVPYRHFYGLGRVAARGPPMPSNDGLITALGKA